MREHGCAERGSGTGALTGTSVLDLTGRIAGPYCSMLLAGLGTEVLKVEPPGGDYLRSWPPFAGGQPDAEQAIHFLHLNRGKRSVVRDPEVPADQATVAALARRSDVVIVDDESGHGVAWEIDPAALREGQPRLVVARLPLFPSGNGPEHWRRSELIVSALSGLAACTGKSDREPLKAGGQIASVAHGQTAAVAIAIALFARRRHGSGSTIEIAAVDAAADLLEMWACGPYRHRAMPRLGRGVTIRTFPSKRTRQRMDSSASMPIRHRGWPLRN